MAEALINQLGEGRITARSAGSSPAGFVHPNALATLRRHGIEPGITASQSWDEYADQSFNYVITVCDSAAAEPCPAFPGTARRLHWSTPDPAGASGTDEQIDAAFENAFAMLKSRVQDELL